MRVLVLSQWFRPEPNLIATSVAMGLKRLGHEVQVLTGFPNYPGGKLYPGYKIRPFHREVLDEVPVVRVPLYPSHDTSGVKRIATYSSFAVSASFFGVPRVTKPDVVYVYHPPATVGLPAIFLQMLRKVPFVYHIQDLWPDTLAATGMVDSKLIHRLVGKWCNLVYSRASELIVLSPGFKRLLIERGVPEAKINMIYNWADETTDKLDEVEPAIVAALDPDNRFNILFAGNMGQAQALEAVIDAARLVRDRAPYIQFVFIGSGVATTRLKEHAAQVGADNVLFLPRQPRSKIDAIMSLADVLLVHLKDDPLFSVTVPSKTQAYLAIGKPIMMGVAGDAAELVEIAQAGLRCQPENPKHIADVALQFYVMSDAEREALGRNGRAYYQRSLSMEQGVKGIAEVLERAAASNGRG